MRLKDHAADPWYFCPKQHTESACLMVSDGLKLCDTTCNWKPFSKDPRTGRVSGIEDLTQLFRFEDGTQTLQLKAGTCFSTVLCFNQRRWSHRSSVSTNQTDHLNSICTSQPSCQSAKLVDNATERSRRWSMDLLPKKQTISALDDFSRPGILWRNMQLKPLFAKIQEQVAHLELKTSCSWFASKIVSNSAIVGWHLLQHSLLFWSKKRIAQVICLQQINSNVWKISAQVNRLVGVLKLVDNATERSRRWSRDLLAKKHTISARLMDSDGLELCDTTCSWNPVCKDSKTGRFFGVEAVTQLLGPRLCNCRLALASARSYVLIKENDRTGHVSLPIKLIIWIVSARVNRLVRVQNWSTMRLKDHAADQWIFCPKSKQYLPLMISDGLELCDATCSWNLFCIFCKDSRTGRLSGVEDLMQLVRFQNGIKTLQL